MDDILKEALETMKDINLSKARAANIKVVGVGGAGCNIIEWLYKKKIENVDLIAMNTDAVHLKSMKVDPERVKRILLGPDITKGHGAGGKPEVAEQAARESAKEIKQLLEGADLVWVVAGMGGGTGTGAAPVVAEIAQNVGALVTSFAITPFRFEGRRLQIAWEGIRRLTEFSNTTVILDNNKLFEVARGLNVQQAFALSNELVAQTVSGVVEIVTGAADINRDLADIKAIMEEGHVAAIGIGESSSENRLIEAVTRAIKHPLLDVDVKGAKGALIYITAGPDFKIDELKSLETFVKNNLDSNAYVSWGLKIREDFGEKVRVIAIVTGVKSPYIIGKDFISRKKDEYGIDKIL